MKKELQLKMPTQTDSPAQNLLQLTRYSTIKPEPIHWLWHGYLATRKVTMLNGEPGHGKSLVSLDIAARITTGQDWPDEQKNLLPPSSVILLTEEEDPADTVLPRFLAAGGDPTKFFAVSVAGGDLVFQIESHLPLLEDRIAEDAPDTKIVIFDPLIDYVSAKPNRDEEVRRVLNKLGKWARMLELAALGINHLNKKTDLPALHRVSGARGWISVARLNFLVGKESESDLRHLCPLKRNLGPEDGSLDYTIQSKTIPGNPKLGDQATVLWLGKGSTAADQLTSATQKNEKADEVQEWLTEVLHPVGEWHESSRILKAGTEKGFSRNRIYRAAHKIRVDREMTPTSPPHGRWRLLPEAPNPEHTSITFSNCAGAS